MLMNILKERKKWVPLAVAVLVILFAIFPGQRMRREGQFEGTLAYYMEARGRNTEHISVCLESMCELIDLALESEDVYEQRTDLSAVSAWADDCAESMGEIDDYFYAYINTKDRSYVGQFTTGSYEVQDGCLKLSAWLIPYIIGQNDLDEACREVLMQAKADFLWMNGLWESAFPEELTEKEFIAAYHGLFYDNEPDFNRFLIEVRQALNAY